MGDLSLLPVSTAARSRVARAHFTPPNGSAYPGAVQDQDQALQ